MDLGKYKEADDVYLQQSVEVTLETTRQEFLRIKQRDGRVDPRPVIKVLASIKDRHLQSLMHIAARAAIASRVNPQMKFIISLVESGFPMDQIDDTGKDPLTIFVHKDVDPKILTQACTMFLKQGYKVNKMLVSALL